MAVEKRLSERNKDSYFSNIEVAFPVNIRWVEKRNRTLKFGDKVRINSFVTITALGSIEIGEWCTIGPGVVIVDHDHLMNENMEDILHAGPSAPVKIGKYVYIGANAVILKGVTLGDYCVVGAGAIVTHSFPEKSVVVGNPARLLRTR